MPAATKSRPSVPFSDTVSSTVSAAVVLPVRVSVNTAAEPSVTGGVDFAAIVTTGNASSTVPVVNELAVACGFAPPPTLVARLATSNPFAPVPSGPKATLTSLPAAPAARLSCNVAVCAAAPLNVTRGVAVPSFASVTPVFNPCPAFKASDQSASATPVPPIASGTAITSPAASARPKLTVNSTGAPSARGAPEPVRASDTTVASLSTIVTST